MGVDVEQLAGELGDVEFRGVVPVVVDYFGGWGDLID